NDTRTMADAEAICEAVINRDPIRGGIMASDHVNRINRLNTWPLRPLLACVNKALADQEPFTPGPQRRFAALPQPFRSRRYTGLVADNAKTALMTRHRHKFGD